MLNQSSESYWEWLEKNGHSFSQDTMLGSAIIAYPIFMFIGIFATIIFSIIRFKQKGIPLRELEWTIMIAVPLGIIGGTIFGKLFAVTTQTWYHIFFFWEPGMSLFGALLFGMVASFAFLYRRSKLTLISMWVYADCIIPNILLGQAIGRWGNFYNHEILGSTINIENYSWLPDFIKNKMFSFKDLEFDLASIVGHDDNGNQFTLLQLLNMENWKGVINHTIVDSWFTSWHFQKLDGSVFDSDSFNALLDQQISYQEPLFLYESLADFAAWILLAFCLPNIVKLINKPKPWELQPKAYPGWFNKQYKSISKTELLEWNTQLPIKYRSIKVKDESGKSFKVRMSLTQAWNKAYYLYEANKDDMDALYEQIDKYENQKANQLENLKKAKQLYKNNKNEKSKEKYILKRNEIYSIIGSWNREIVGSPFGKELEKLFNPNSFKVLRSGILTGLYITIYLIIRIILETRRIDAELFIQNCPSLDYILLTLLLIIGISIVVLTQFIAPKRWRKAEWLYERSY